MVLYIEALELEVAIASAVRVEEQFRVAGFVFPKVQDTKTF